MIAVRTLPWIAALAALAFAFGWHIAVGAKTIPLGTVLDALVAYDAGTFDHVVVRDLRMPRALVAIGVGAALAVAGALMQGVTRNPLADPGLLGLLVGASFAVVLFHGFLGLGGAASIPVFAALGALGGALVVWGVASAAPGGATPLTLVLSGAALTGFLGALISVLHLIDEESFEQLRVWLTGTLAGRRIETALWALPWALAGLGVALLCARQVTALAMGEETATGLGVDVGKLQVAVLFAVVALTAAAVAVAGPMGFVGLVIPHVVRLFIGQDYRRIVPWSAFAGALYMLIADIAARLVLAPIEISTGLVTAFLGAPFFVWLVRARL
ncbi:FecCD family ABC transporter permease [Pontivivens ytuae]|uniref:Iron ABC transporter permease n=1 Tax=Pontivivens ytuae TaxID=2789856 RepID=A0A7S9LUR7_9RHOB|nr:iron ABC transporter permease [Pontivivens ytuae]QPH55632.1 iron ABC transporter permease [Pontivivens ytuae]